MIEYLTWIPSRIWEAIAGRRRIQFLMHHAFFLHTGEAAYFFNVTNLSRDRDTEITHVWLALNGEIPVLNPDRPLPRRLRPDETWETWVPADQLPSDLGERAVHNG